MSQNTNEENQGSAPAEQNRYFNQYANGIGYLNGIRAIGPEEKPSRYAVQLSVIQGPADNVHYEYHDLIVSSETALSVVMKHRESIESEEAKVLIHFNMANPRAKGFIYKQGERAGQVGASIGGFLTRIFYLKVDGNKVYEDERVFDDQEYSRQAAAG